MHFLPRLSLFFLLSSYSSSLPHRRPHTISPRSLLARLRYLPWYLARTISPRSLLGHTRRSFFARPPEFTSPLARRHRKPQWQNRLTCRAAIGIPSPMFSWSRSVVVWTYSEPPSGRMLGVFVPSTRLQPAGSFQDTLLADA